MLCMDMLVHQLPWVHAKNKLLEAQAGLKSHLFIAKSFSQPYTAQVKVQPC